MTRGPQNSETFRRVLNVLGSGCLVRDAPTLNARWIFDNQSQSGS